MTFFEIQNNARTSADFNLKATSTSTHHNLAMAVPSFQYGAFDYILVEPFLALLFY